jgi:excisionase family DNA binding protein
MTTMLSYQEEKAEQKSVLTVRLAAAYLNLSEEQVCRLINDNVIPSCDVCDVTLIPKELLDAQLTELCLMHDEDNDDGSK